MRLAFRIAISLIIVLSNLVQAQDSVWTLRESVDYAIKNNITIQQSELNRRLAELSFQQSRLSQLPSVNANTSYGRSYGRSVDPTTNQFVENTSYDFLSLGANADVLLFGWFQKRNRIAQNRLSMQAAEVDMEQTINDISLNVATGYLRALLAKEQVNTATQQAALSEAQMVQTKKFADAGRVPELNVAQMEAQLISDSAALITAITDYNSSILDLKALLNLDFNTPLFIEEPVNSVTDNLDAALASPETIYEEASRNLGTIKSSELRVEAAKKGYNAAKGGLYPQLALSYQFGTNYATTFKDFTITDINSEPVDGTYALGPNGTRYIIYQPSPVFTTSTTPLGKQIDNNLRQTISLGINIPIFNGWQQQSTVKQARINILSQKLNQQQAQLTLKQDVYKAHNDVKNAIQKYYAAKRALEANERAYDYAEKRYELGLTNTVEYLVIRNNWVQAQSNYARAKYDLIFKLKVIDYYMGEEIKL